MSDDHFIRPDNDQEPPAAEFSALADEYQSGLDKCAAIGMQGDFLKDLSYDELLDLGHIVQREIKNIMESAFDHPEASTIRRKR